MGGEYSVGQDNDDLIDKLKEKDYIRTVEVERIFRMVDRAHYYLEENRKTAYEDIAWRNGLLHMSAPCIYSKVMEALELCRGLSFLNLGSGTGYLNTLVGYAIGPFGINHGIELHADNVTYARQRLEEFIQSAPRFDDLELCEPKFVVGNCLNLSVENRLYDRVYCGAACPPDKQEVLQNMIKIGGILITPVGDQLLKIKRLSATEFTSENILPVSFASLIVPSQRESPDEAVLMPEVDPLSLQCISRIAIRNTIRSTFEFNLPVPKASKSRRKGRRSEASRSLYPGLASFNFVPTRNGIMVMGFGSPRDGAWSQHILPLGRRSAGGENAAAETDSDDSTADDIEEAEDEEDDDDGNLLDRQLRIHARALRHIRERSAVNSAQDRDVDSDISDDDEESHNAGSSLPEDVNGNSTNDVAIEPPGSSSVENPSTVFTKETSSKKRGFDKEQLGKCSLTTELLFPDATNGENNEHNVQDTRRSNEHCTAKNSPLTCEDEIEQSEDQEQHTDATDPISCSKSSSSMVIDVPSTGISIQKQVSYSTSADTSETSGFGSLGDDAGLLPESFKESSVSSDTLHALSADLGDGDWHSSSTSRWKRESVDEGIESNSDVTWMDVEEERNAVENEVPTEVEALASPLNDAPNDDSEPGISRCLSDEGMDHENSTENFDSDHDINMRHVLARFPRLVKRGQSNTSSEDSENSKETEDSDGEEASENKAEKAPGFSSFLKEKVDTLPIPNSIKAFVLHYR
ncbi:protein-L-isoaspartate O-methyltransferase domain-containing protein 1-like [Elysia marginata]|uniref:Protein-L-isoaspartate O-methyltransferase domain-containing protein 1-like n=1 Tax=Elysia marginata TaxID=1093978 RepID=A0AAV4IL28_9GAST|nr:protein-L-isoaspartate O-methyltransferase domain-containing protein 1-like [Elysia marginata]